MRGEDPAKTSYPELQDLLGSLVKVRVYTHICYCFPLPDRSSLPQAVNILTRGLEQLQADVPWVTGRVVIQTTESGQLTRPLVVKTESAGDVEVIDLTDSAAVHSGTPSYAELRKNGFPFTMLDASMLISQKSVGFGYENNTAAVFLVQLTVINGGIILTVSGEHSQMDGQGVGQLTRLFSKACRKEPLTQEEILQSNRAHGDVIPLLDAATYTPGPELARYIKKPKTDGNVNRGLGATGCTWAYFHFSKLSMAQLKELASSTKPPGVSYITTDDALSALIWQCASRARKNRLDADTISTFVRAVNVRPYFGLPRGYLGNMTSHTRSPLSLSDLSASPLGTLAGLLRAALIPDDLIYGVRSLATYAANLDDFSSLGFGGEGIEPSRDIWFSSWANLPCREFDFGLGLGLPERVRIPRLTALEGLMYLLPMDKDGGIDAAICLKDEDLNLLKEDQAFVQWGEWIG